MSTFENSEDPDKMQNIIIESSESFKPGVFKTTKKKLHSIFTFYYL